MSAPPPRVSGRAVLAARVAAALAVAGGLSCRETHLYPVRALDASFLQPPPVDAADANPGPDLQAVVDAPAAELPLGYRCPDSQVVGFATTGAGTTGGGGVPPVTVTTAADLMTYVGVTDDPQVVEIGTSIVLTGQVRVRSNKTIRGTALGAGLTGGGLYLKDSKNVILQRLTISKAVGTDAIGLDHAQNIWIDHCDLSSELDSPKETYDGLVDITHASDAVTVSWTILHDHYHASLVGHSVDNAVEDTGHLTVTYHHNWFRRVPNYNPRVRFGKIHIFNNLYEYVPDYPGTAIASQMGATIFIEGSVFRDVQPLPITTTYEDPQPGTAREERNDFSSNCGPNIITMTTTWIPPYTGYPLDPTDLVSAIVKKCAGTNF